MGRMPPKGWRPSVGEDVMIVSHFGFESGPYRVVKLTPGGAFRVAHNEVSSSLFKDLWGDGVYRRAHTDRVTIYATLAPILRKKVKP